MPEVAPLNSWIAKCQDLARYLQDRLHEPLCFVIGAGASMSSGGPATEQVASRLDRVTAGRFSGLSAAERRSALDYVTEDEKRAAIEPLFIDPLQATPGSAEPGWLTPYVGYRCLVAMGRRRRIYVLNFNWDLAVESACRLLGVSCDSVSLAEGPEKVERCLSGSDPGVVVVHLHGQWNREVPLDYGTLETLSFDDDDRKLLSEHALKYTTIVIGLSMAEDLNLRELIQELSEERREVTEIRPLYICMRGDGPAAPAKATMEGWLRSRRSQFNSPSGEDLDFDRLLVELRAADLGVSFEDVRDESVAGDLSALDEIVWPDPQLVRGLLDRRTLAFIGEPTLGKSTIGHLVAFWRLLTQEARGMVHTVRGRSAALKAVTALLATAGENDQLVVEDPFGLDSIEDNERIALALGELADRQSGPGAVITSRLTIWERVSDRHASIEGLSSSEADPGAWYSASDLIRYTKSLGRHELARFEEAIRSRRLNTPARIRNAFFGFQPSVDDPGSVADKALLLEGCFATEGRRPIAMLALLARLQELTPESKTRDELLSHAGSIDSDTHWRQARSMLFRFPMDGQERLKLMHETDREAVDRFIGQRLAEVSAALTELGPLGRWAQEAMRIWESLDAVRAGDPRELVSLPPKIRTQWAGPLVAGASADRLHEVIDLLLDDQAQDFWSLCDVAYEALGRWDTLAKDPRRASSMIERILGDRERMGAYALLEAALYLQAIAPADVWLPLQEAIRRLARFGEHDFELTLIFDALVWRPPSVSDDSKRQLFELLLEAAEDRPSLTGAYAVACAYHPQGAAPLTEELGLHNPFERLRTFTEAQGDAAARIVRFHFAHQSRARAAWARRPFEGGDLEYLARTTYEAPLPLEHAEKVTAMIEALAADGAQAGWAVHLGLNTQNTRGTFSDDQMARIMKLLPDSVDDAGIAAAATYQVPDDAARALRKWFRSDLARSERALDLLRGGLAVDGWRVRPPEFQFVRDLAGFWEMIGCQWPRLNDLADVDTSDPVVLLLEYERVAKAAVEHGVDEADVITLLGHARAGDLRFFELAAAAREGTDPHLRNVILAARHLREPPRLL